MDNTIERIKKEIKDWQADIHDNEYDADKFDFVFDRILEIIDEELAKEPQECNSDLISKKKLIRDLFYSADGNRYPTRDCDNFPITISFEDLRKAINNQQQVQPIVRSIDEIADAANMSCPPRYCEHDCGSPEYECKQCWIEWLTKKEV